MEHFTKRLYACIIDFIVVFLLISIVNNLLFVPLSLLKITVLSAYYPYVVTVIVTMAYFTIMEAKTNKTIGKKVMKLYVSDEEGYLSYSSAFIRNITKCFWVLLIFDVIIGKLFGLPSRLFDKIAGNDVYADDELEAYDETQNNQPKAVKEPAKLEENADKKQKDIPAKDVEKEAIVEPKKDVDKAVIESKEVTKVNEDKKSKTNPVKKQADKKDEDIVTANDVEDKKVEPVKEEHKDNKKNTQPDVVFADDSDIRSVYPKKDKTKTNVKKDDKKSTAKEVTSDKKEKNQAKDLFVQNEEDESDKKVTYDDEILNLIEEDDSDSFVELTKDDF